MNKLKHGAVVLAVLFLFLGIPTLVYVDVPALLSGNADADAVSHATTELPAQPSGEFIILINREKLADTLEQWQTFFSGEDAGVIMCDIDCMVIDSDAPGIQLAERFQARLAENQMKIRRENGLLLASKTEHGLFDTVLISRELAENYQISVGDDVLCVEMKGE